MKKFFFVFILSMFFYSYCRADTSFSGLITEDTIWSKSNSPYILTGQVVVDVGVKLTIEPGVKILFQSNSPLLIFGDVYANGNVDERISFVGSLDFVYYPKINTYNSLDSYFKFTDFKNVDGINLFHSIVDLDNINISDSNNGIKFFDGSVAELNNSFVDSSGISVALFTNSSCNITDSEIHSGDVNTNNASVGVYGSFLNMKSSKVSSDFIPLISSYDSNINLDSLILNSGLSYGIRSSNSKINIDSSEIRGSPVYGVVLFGGDGVSILDSDIVDNNIGISEFENSLSKDLKLSFNRIQSNNIGLIVYGSRDNPSVVDARNNWWGDASGPLVENPTHDPSLDDLVNLSGLGNPIVIRGQELLYKPWLLSPHEKPVECCSSVVFLPGLQASRLYKKQILEDQLWEPNAL